MLFRSGPLETTATLKPLEIYKVQSPLNTHSPPYEVINSRITEAEEQISDVEDRMVKFTAVEQNKEKRMKRNEDSLRDLWDDIKHNNIYIIGVPEEEEREKGPEKIIEEIIV